MALSARIPSGLDTNKFIPELFSRNVLKAVKNKLVTVSAVNHSYEKELVKGDTLYITRTNTVTATEITIGTEGVQKNPFNTTAVTLTVNQYYEAPVTIDYMSRRQSQVDLVGEAEDESAYAIAKIVDTSVCDLFSALSGSTGYGTDGSAITDSVLISAVEELDEADAPDENRVWILDPSAKADLMGIDKFVRVDYGYGEQVPTGTFRKDVYGAPVRITNNLTANSTGNYGVYMHRDAIAIVISERLDVDRVDQPLKHQLIVNTSALWGVIELRDTFGMPILTRLA